MRLWNAKPQSTLVTWPHPGLCLIKVLDTHDATTSPQPRRTADCGQHGKLDFTRGWAGEARPGCSVSSVSTRVLQCTVGHMISQSSNKCALTSQSQNTEEQQVRQMTIAKKFAKGSFHGSARLCSYKDLWVVFGQWPVECWLQIMTKWHADQEVILMSPIPAEAHCAMYSPSPVTKGRPVDGCLGWTDNWHNNTGTIN